MTVQLHWPVLPHAESAASRHKVPVQHAAPPAVQPCPALTQLLAWQVPEPPLVKKTQFVPLQQS
jgi:hypothetical protein